MAPSPTGGSNEENLQNCIDSLIIEVVCTHPSEIILCNLNGQAGLRFSYFFAVDNPH